MIEIKLTGDDAIKYLAESNPDIKQMEETIRTAQTYIEALENQLAVLGDPKEPIHTNLDDPLRHNIGGSMNRPSEMQEVSARVLRDTEIAKEAAPMLKPQLDMTTKKGNWTDREIGVIMYAISRPEKELNRKFSVLVEKLGRTNNSVRAKLSDLGIRVAKDIIYKD
jgi:hypothetical protein